METKILKAVFGGGRYAVTSKRTRTDYGQVLEFVGIDLPDTFECIFSNSATSAGVGKKQIGSAQRVLIPDEYLATGQTIYAWVLVHDSEDDGRHMYSVKIPVDDMPDLSPEEPTPVEQSVISQAIAALNTAVDTTSQKALEVSESADRAEHAADGIEAYVERAESAQHAAESARDRAAEAETSARTSANASAQSASQSAQIKSDVENLVDDALASADASERSANHAYTYATSAERSSVNASASASSAQRYTSQAQASANTASGKASEASTSAQTASTKATESAQSAENALTYKTDAESAKTASQTAQELAESARDGAVTAKEDAESARSEAQDIVDGITGKVEQIDSNTDRIESLEDDRYKPYPTDTASGSIASFSDGADDIPLKSCIVQVEPVQEGSGDPSPENERPISGFTGCEVTRNSGDYAVFGVTTGKTLNASGEAVSESGMGVSDWMPVNTGDTVTLKYVSTSGERTRRVIGYDANKAFVSILSSVSWANVGQEITQTVTVESGVKYVRASFFVNDTNKSFINESSVTTYPITFPSEAGIVYGAYIDVINGELVVEYVRKRVNSDLGSVNFSTSRVRYTVSDAMPMNSETSISDANIMCSHFRKVSASTIAGCRYTYGDNYETAFILFQGLDTFGIENTLEGWNTFLESHEVYVTYKLAEPIHYPLTSNQINSLYGQNNIWANTGDTEVEYRADVTLYINRLTEPDADMIADNNITNGSYFMVGNNLYLATANIASGASVIVGTNATKVSLAQALNAIKG